jgi:hypothetical protein
MDQSSTTIQMIRSLRKSLKVSMSLASRSKGKASLRMPAHNKRDATKANLSVIEPIAPTSSHCEIMCCGGRHKPTSDRDKIRWAGAGGEEDMRPVEPSNESFLQEVENGL